MLHNKHIATYIISLQSLYMWMACHGYTTDNRPPPTLTVGNYGEKIFADADTRYEWEKQAKEAKKLREEGEKIKNEIISKLKPASDAVYEKINDTIKKNIEEAAYKYRIEINSSLLDHLMPEQKEGDIILDGEEYYHELEPEIDRIIITVTDATLRKVETFITEVAPTIKQTYGQPAAEHCQIEKSLPDLAQIIVSCPRDHTAELITKVKESKFFKDKLMSIFTDFAMQVSAVKCETLRVSEVIHGTSSDKIAMWYKDMVDGNQNGFHDWEAGTEGRNTIVYVIDTGVMAQHPEFDGRVIQGFDFCEEKKNQNRSAKRPCTKHDDIYNHGTPISALIVGKNFGIAKQARVVSVKCSDDIGGMLFSELIQCMEWAMNDSSQYIAAGKRVIFSISQTSMDSEGKKKEKFKHLFKKFTNLGIVTVVAAGNFVDQACSFTPGNVGADILTVGSVEQHEHLGTLSSVKADHSNYGTCVDVYAPGMHVQTLHADGTVVSLHGTSFATPIVAALVANYLSKNNKATATQVYKYFKEVVVEDFSKEQVDFVIREDQWVPGLESMYHEIFGPFRRIRFPCPMPKA